MCNLCQSQLTLYSASIVLLFLSSILNGGKILKGFLIREGEGDKERKRERKCTVTVERCRIQVIDCRNKTQVVRLGYLVFYNYPHCLL